LNHTFASFSTLSASHLLEDLTIRVVRRKPARSSYNMIFCAKGNASRHWPFLLFMDFVLKAALFLSAGCFCVRRA
jgi:hypothetical protein